jgi:DNA-binding LacI/PurR family transcriptional regulator
MASTTPARDRAVAFLKKVCAAHPSGTRLSAIDSLARQCGVSPVTMLSAVTICQKAGLLTSVRGQGVWAGKPPETQCGDPVRQRDTIGDIVMAFSRDILRGEYTPDSRVPSRVSLQQRYGVGYSAITIMLHRAARSGLVYKQGQAWRISSSVVHSSRNRIAIVGGGSRQDQIKFFRPRADQFIRSLETQALQRNCRLVWVRHEITDSGVVFFNERGQTFYSLPDTRNLLGIIVWNHDTRLIRALASHNIPVAVIQEDESDALDSLELPGVRCFQIGFDTRCAAQMGTYLLSRGHRRIAFLSWITRGWSENRLRGHCTAFDTAGYPDAVTVVNPPDSAQLHYFRPEAHASTQRSVQWYASRIQFINKERARIARSFTPVFSRCIEQKEITAWVGANDTLALHALDYLQSLDPPPSIAVAGFDDTHEGLINHLTSYHFDLDMCARAMITHVINPRTIPGWRKATPYRIGGWVVERGSTIVE